MSRGSLFACPAKLWPVMLLPILLCQHSAGRGEEASPPVVSVSANDATTMTPAEEKFAKLLTGSQLVGRYTTWENPDQTERDTYTLEKVSKLDGGLWMFVARIQYGDHDVRLPLPLPVKWAGDTPVITLDKLPIPGFGTFSARIVIHENQYAGTWDGGDHGGHMFGRIVKTKEAEDEQSETDND